MANPTDTPIHVLVMGAGVYVCGRGTPGYGTVLPTLFEGRRRRIVGAITVCATQNSSLDEIQARAATLGRLMKVEGEINCILSPPDIQEIISRNGSPVAAVVAVPDMLHADVSVPLLEQGIHCLIVKPFATTMIQARRMCEAASQGLAYGAVEFHKQWDGANIRLRNEIRTGRLGTPLYAMVEYSQQKRVPLEYFRGWAHHTNVFQYLGVHYVDLIAFATGYQPERVSACGQKVYLTTQGIDTEDSIQVMVQWKPDHGVPFVSTHVTNWIDPNVSSAMSDQRLTVVGTAGRYSSDQKHRGVQIVTDEQGVEDVNPYFSTLGYDAFLGAQRCWGYGPDSILTFLDDVQHLLSDKISLSDLEPTRPTFTKALASTATVEAASESLKQVGNWVSVLI